MAGWFTTFNKSDTACVFLRFRWWDERQRKKCSVYLGSLGVECDHPTRLLDTIVNKALRMDCTLETLEQQDKHLEMLLRLRDMDKSWEAWEQRWNAG